MNAGFGSPTFFFYPPIPYYFTSLLSPLSHFSTSICNALGLSSLLALVASGLTAYLWLKEIAPRTPAFIAALAYMVWPYHLAVDLYTRFAFAEYWSFVWLPLILYFCIKVARGSRRGVIGLAVSLALLALTHLPTLIIFLPVPIGYVFFLADRAQWRLVSIRLGLAAVLAVGLSAIYWLPAITTQDSVSMEVMSARMYQYANNFLFAGPAVGHDRTFWRSLELLTVLTGGLAVCAWKLSISSSRAKSARESNYWVIVALFSLFMTLPVSQIVWAALPAIQRVQFPWRFDTVLAVATVGLLARAGSQLPLRDIFPAGDRMNLLGAVVLVGAVVAVATVIQLLPLQKAISFPGSRSTVLPLCFIALLLVGMFFIQRPIAVARHRLFWIGGVLAVSTCLASYGYSYKRILFSRLDDLGSAPRIAAGLGAEEHRPRWVPKGIFNVGALTNLGKRLPMVQSSGGQASWLIRQWQPRRIVIQVSAITGADFTIHQFFFPGWTAKIQGVPQSLPVHPSELGLIQISVPPGEHEVAITLDALKQERIGQVLGGLSAMMALLLVVLFRGDSSTRMLADLPKPD